MIKSASKFKKNMAKSQKSCMEQAEIIDTFGTYHCFMAKAKVSSSKASYDTSDCSSYESDSKVSYAKLAKLSSRQQDELDSLSKTIQKSEVMLIDEIEKGQTLTNEHAALKEKFDEIQSRHDLLSADHENLTYEFLQRKVALKNLKEAHEEIDVGNMPLRQ